MTLGGAVLLRKMGREIAQLHHFRNFDVVNVYNEYIEWHYLSASLYPHMSELMLE